MKCLTAKRTNQHLWITLCICG